MKTTRFFGPLMLAVLFAATSLLSLNTAQAQSDLADEDRATVLFDIRMGKMRDGKFMKSIQDQVDELRDSMPTPDELDPEKMDRIFGAMTLPDSVSEMEEMQMGRPESFQFFVRIQMTDEESANEFYESMAAESETMEMNGETYLIPPGDGEQGIYAHLIEEENTIEMGTELYLKQPSRRLFTKGLAEAFKKTPDHGIRLVIDLASEAELISELVAMGEAEADQMMKPLLGMVDNAADLRVSIDFDSKNLLSIGATGVSESDAEELRGGLDGLLGMAKMFGGAGADQIPDPDMAKMAKSVLDSLKATRDDLDVHIDIPRPDGFSKAVKQGLEMVPMMMGGGGGFDGSDF